MITEIPIFAVQTPELVAGVRIDRILSYRYDPGARTLAIRYMGETELDQFEGTVAEKLHSELIYCGRLK